MDKFYKDVFAIFSQKFRRGTKFELREFVITKIVIALDEIVDLFNDAILPPSVVVGGANSMHIATRVKELRKYPFNETLCVVYEAFINKFEENEVYGRSLGLKKDEGENRVWRLLNGKRFGYWHIEHMYCKLLILVAHAQGSRASVVPTFWKPHLEPLRVKYTTNPNCAGLPQELHDLTTEALEAFFDSDTRIHSKFTWSD